MINIRGKILVVEDDEAALDIYRMILEEEGCTVVPARDGVEALEKFDLIRPDVVLLDLMLPRLNGLEICSRLRRNTRGHTVPIIMLTGLDDNDAKVRALESGVNDFLAKPVQRTELLGRVRSALEHRQREHDRSTLEHARQELQTLQQLLADAQQQPAAYTDGELLALLQNATKACRRLDAMLS